MTDAPKPNVPKCFMVWALSSCSHLSDAGWRDAVQDHGDGTFTLKDGCRVRGMKNPPAWAYGMGDLRNGI